MPTAAPSAARPLTRMAFGRGGQPFAARRVAACEASAGVAPSGSLSGIRMIKPLDAYAIASHSQLQMIDAGAVRSGAPEQGMAENATPRRIVAILEDSGLRPVSDLLLAEQIVVWTLRRYRAGGERLESLAGTFRQVFGLGGVEAALAAAG